MIFIVIAIMAIVFLILWACIDIVPQAEARVIERLGVFRAVWNAGIHVKIPIIDRAVVPHIDLREQVLELPKIGYGNIEYTNSNHGDTVDKFSVNGSGIFIRNKQPVAIEYSDGSVAEVPRPNFLNNGLFKGSHRFTKNCRTYKSTKSYSEFRDVITKDNVRMEVDAAVFYQVTDPRLYAYGMKQPLFALQKLAITTLRNIIGTLELDETLCSREFINAKLRATLDEATDSWGIKITRVEIESIVPPADVQDAMEKQAKAERQKRADILEAEGKKQATILAAEAEKQKKILEAEGLLREKELEALGVKALNENAPNDSVIRLKAIQGMEKVADGQATKVIIPSDLAGLVGLANGLVEGAGK